MKEFVDLPIARVKSVLRYEPDSGLLFWLPRPIRYYPDRSWNSRYAGQIAGGSHPKGYVRVRIDGVGLLAHRVCWLLHHGEWPERFLDHIDGDKRNNRIVNLRQADVSQNGFNRGPTRKNRLGMKGVFYSSKDRVYYSQISAYGHRIHLGSFSTAEAAQAAYAEAAARLMGEFDRKPT